MKSYTDLEQSKKLAEILSIESADGFYATNVVIAEPYITYLNGERNIPGYKGAVPCWSLTTLLELLPDKVTINNEKYCLVFNKKVVEYRGPITWDGQKSISSEACNLIDACYEMILKLHEQNLI